MFAYMTLADTLEVNARRHYARAAQHRADGHPAEWADGSMRKGDRNMERAKLLRTPVSVSNRTVEATIRRAMWETAAAIAKNILGEV